MVVCKSVCVILLVTLPKCYLSVLWVVDIFGINVRTYGRNLLFISVCVILLVIIGKVSFYLGLCRSLFCTIKCLIYFYDEFEAGRYKSIFCYIKYHSVFD